jgi:molybdopterin-guanine dinucleotide biosynthesis protein B
VSVVKHAHHRFDIDHPGKDTFRHREAGAFEVVMASDRRLALMREFEQPGRAVGAPSAGRAVGRRGLGAGGRLSRQRPAQDRGLAPRHRPASARYPEDDFIAAIATDDAAALPEPTLRPVLDLNDAEASGPVADRQCRRV